MNLRVYSKDRLAEKSSLSEVQVASIDLPTSSDPFKFWITKDGLSHLVDLSSLRDGQDKHNGKWAGAFSGRPGLAHQLLPALKDGCVGLSKSTTHQICTNLRTWWRVLDAVEAGAHAAGSPIARVDGVASLIDLHRQRAYDAGLRGKVFREFLRPVNITRLAIGLKQLHWLAPNVSPVKRRLAPEWQVTEIRRSLRRHWFSALDRWTAAEALLNAECPSEGPQATLWKGYSLYKLAMERHGKAFLELHEFSGDLTTNQFYESFMRIDPIRSGFFPDVSDIRAAFHRCLSETGWNPSTLLDLDVGNSFIETHPTDPSRYVMTGWKGRSETDQPHVGLWKTVGSPGKILTELIGRTKPLRDQLITELNQLRINYSKMIVEMVSEAILVNTFKKIQNLEVGICSPWLYCGRHGISWLNMASYNKMGKGKHYLSTVIREINSTNPTERLVDTSFLPSDFRDAYAAYVWMASGGSVLHVMKALGHRTPQSAVAYTNNVLLNEAGERIFFSFGNALWVELGTYGRMDATLIAKTVQDGPVSDGDRTRLKDYRMLRRSRLGIGCKNPEAPPRRIAPNFVADGKRVCDTPRCTLCYENAVILPESLSGLCMRVEELRFIQSTLAVPVWIRSGYPTELVNTLDALKLFDPKEVDTALVRWANRISSGNHRIPGFEAGGIDGESSEL